MKSRRMKQLRWPVNAEQAAYMRMRQEQNQARSNQNQNENWFAAKLESTRKAWTRGAVWGYRVFDFWCHELGVAVEVDGPEHRPDYDGYRDDYNFGRSGIIVLRVRNRNEDDAARALQAIHAATTWAVRREQLGLHARSKKGRRKWVSGQDDLFEGDAPEKS
jgi:very-short-patch-repair endonuclease